MTLAVMRLCCEILSFGAVWKCSRSLDYLELLFKTVQDDGVD